MRKQILPIIEDNLRLFLNTFECQCQEVLNVKCVFSEGSTIVFVFLPFHNGRHHHHRMIRPSAHQGAVRQSRLVFNSGLNCTNQESPLFRILPHENTHDKASPRDPIKPHPSKNEGKENVDDETVLIAKKKLLC